MDKFGVTNEVNDPEDRDDSLERKIASNVENARRDYEGSIVALNLDDVKPTQTTRPAK